jgi:hypothetical protein
MGAQGVQGALTALFGGFRPGSGEGSCEGARPGAVLGDGGAQGHGWPRAFPFFARLFFARAE